MFTGLIQKVGELISVQLGIEGGRLLVRSGPWDPPPTPGESMCVSGACLTLVSHSGDQLSFDALQETFRRTGLGTKKKGDRLNLERALRVGDAVGGHLVTGHVDGIGRVRSRRRAGRDWILEITCEPALLRGMVPKGSIACDGVSLTVVDLEETFFSVHIIPFTWDHTALSSLQVGDAVNLETDILGKYVRQLLQQGSVGKGITMASLREAGFIS